MQARDPGWIQTPLWEPKVTWSPTELGALPSWTDAKRVCVDVECRDDDLTTLGPGVRRGGYVCGIGFAIEDGPSHYLPIRHEGGGNLDPAAVWAYLKDQAASFAGEAIFNSAPYDLDYLWENKIEFPKIKFYRDVQVAEPLLDENQDTYGLDAICARRGLPGKDERELREHAKAWGIDPKKGLWRLHSGAVGRYAERDVRAPLELLRRQEREIEEQDLQRIYDLESRVTPALVRMTRRGIPVDLDELDRVEIWATQRLQDYLDQIHHLTGVRVASISNARELYPALKKRGLDVQMVNHKGTGKLVPSITKLWLAQQDDDVAKAIVAGREFQKLLTTYVAGFRKHMVGNRIHPSFKQLHSASDEDEDEDDGARFGRCAAKHPNIQAQMKRSKEIQKKWRRVISAEKGKKRYEADYCYSADTEVLTRRGWVRIDEIVNSEAQQEIAQWDKGEISFVVPSAYFRSAYDGDLVHAVGPHVDLIVTPNHELVLVNNEGRTMRCRADALASVSSDWQFFDNDGRRSREDEVRLDRYTGTVYCLTVPSHCIVVRRSDKAVVCGQSQQEPRTTVHYAEICKLPGADRAAQCYRDNPLQDSYDLMVDLCKLPRDEVKELFLGRSYGMGGGKMAEKLKLPWEWRTNDRDGRVYKAAGPEAQAILDRYDQAVPYVRALARKCEQMAKARGFLISEDGRRLRFPTDPSGNLMWTYKALNRLIQGRAAGQTKTALVMLDDAGYPLDMTIHDAFSMCHESDDYAYQMGEIMKQALPLRVPSRVDVTKGPNYGELKPLIVALPAAAANDDVKTADATDAIASAQEVA